MEDDIKKELINIAKKLTSYSLIKAESSDIVNNAAEFALLYLYTKYNVDFNVKIEVMPRTIINKFEKGRYNSFKNTITIFASNCNDMGDIINTVFHEIYHKIQNDTGKINQEPYIVLQILPKSYVEKAEKLGCNVEEAINVACSIRSSYFMNKNELDARQFAIKCSDLLLKLSPTKESKAYKNIKYANEKAKLEEEEIFEDSKDYEFNLMRMKTGSDEIFNAICQQSYNCILRNRNASIKTWARAIEKLALAWDVLKICFNYNLCKMLLGIVIKLISDYYVIKDVVPSDELEKYEGIINLNLSSVQSINELYPNELNEIFNDRNLYSHFYNAILKFGNKSESKIKKENLKERLI